MVSVGDKALLMKNRDMMWLEEGGTPSIGDEGFLVRDENTKVFLEKSSLFIGDYGNLFNIDNQYFVRGKPEHWRQKALFPGHARSTTFSFEINGNGYVGGGYHETVGVGVTHADFYRYNTNQDSWTRLADFPGNPDWPYKAYNVAAFKISNDKIFVLGSTSILYQYDVNNDSWINKGHSGIGIGITHRVSFVSNGKGYCYSPTCGAYPNFSNQFWEYDSDSNSWTEKTISWGNETRMSYAAGITGNTIQNTGYLFMGYGEDATFWKYDGSLDVWTEKIHQIDTAPGIGGYKMVGNTSSSKAYIIEPYATGDGCVGVKEYHPISNKWIEKSPFNGTGNGWGCAALILDSNLYAGICQDTKDWRKY